MSKKKSVFKKDYVQEITGLQTTKDVSKSLVSYYAESSQTRRFIQACTLERRESPQNQNSNRNSKKCIHQYPKNIMQSLSEQVTEATNASLLLLVCVVV